MKRILPFLFTSLLALGWTSCGSNTENGAAFAPARASLLAEKHPKLMEWVRRAACSCCSATSVTFLKALLMFLPDLFRSKVGNIEWLWPNIFAPEARNLSGTASTGMARLQTLPSSSLVNSSVSRPHLRWTLISFRQEGDHTFTYYFVLIIVNIMGAV